MSLDQGNGRRKARTLEGDLEGELEASGQLFRGKGQFFKGKY